MIFLGAYGQRSSKSHSNGGKFHRNPPGQSSRHAPPAGAKAFCGVDNGVESDLFYQRQPNTDEAESTHLLGGSIAPLAASDDRFYSPIISDGALSTKSVPSSGNSSVHSTGEMSNMRDKSGASGNRDGGYHIKSLAGFIDHIA